LWFHMIKLLRWPLVMSSAPCRLVPRCITCVCVCERERERERERDRQRERERFLPPGPARAGRQFGIGDDLAAPYSRKT